MKSILLIVTVLALANLLALGSFVGWLAASDRLDSERVRKIREILAVTVTDEKTAVEGAAAEAETKAKAEGEAARLAVPPETAAEKILAAADADDAQMQAVIRRRRELDDVLRAIERQRAEIDTRSTAVKAERAAFDAERKKIEQVASEAQFRKALATLEAQKPADAKNVLESLMAGGKGDQAVAYLSAMEERARSKVVAEFVKGSGSVAADLLEQLRTHGVKTPVASAK
jgi:hypothetical protein